MHFGHEVKRSVCSAITHFIRAIKSSGKASKRPLVHIRHVRMSNTIYMLVLESLVSV